MTEDTNNAAVDSGPETETNAQPQPTPEQIQEFVKNQASQQLAQAAGTLTMLAQQVANMIDIVTNHNPVMSLAIANQIHVMYDQGMRMSVRVQEGTPGTENKDNG